MKAYGDIPASHVETVKELELLARWFDAHGSSIPSLSAAKGFTCIAHDYYMMFMDEMGEIFLDKAHDLCPGYFSGPILIHIAKDGDFASLVGNMVETPALDRMRELGFDYEG